MSDHNDGYGNENEHTAEQLFLAARVGRPAANINKQIICTDIPYEMLLSVYQFIIRYINISSDDYWLEFKISHEIS